MLGKVLRPTKADVDIDFFDKTYLAHLNMLPFPSYDIARYQVANHLLNQGLNNTCMGFEIVLPTTTSKRLDQY